MKAWRIIGGYTQRTVFLIPWRVGLITALALAGAEAWAPAGEQTRRDWSSEAARLLAVIARRLEVSTPKEGWPRMEVRLLDSEDSSFRGVRLTKASSGKIALEVGDAEGLGEKALRDGIVRYVLEVLVEAAGYGGTTSSDWACIPAWYVVGLGEALDDKAWPARRAALKARMAFELPPSASEVLRWHVLPEGWDGPRLWSGFFFEWLAEADSRGGIMGQLLERFGTRVGVSSEWLAITLGFPSAEAMNRSWQQWVAAQRRIIQPPGFHTAADLAVLKKAVWLNGRDEGDKGRWPGEDSSAGEDVRVTARRKVVELRVLGIGRGPEFGDLTERFALLYERLAEGYPPWLLRRAFAEAWNELEQLERITLERTRYMDEAEVRLGGADDAPTDDELCLDHSEMRRYVDEAERRWRRATKGEP